MKIPTLPSTNSLEGVALAYLLNGSRMSHLSFQGETESYCLRAPVFNLRSSGWPIDDCWQAGGFSKISGRRTKFKKYFIRHESLQELRVIFGNRLNLFTDAVMKKFEAAPESRKTNGGI